MDVPIAARRSGQAEELAHLAHRRLEERVDGRWAASEAGGLGASLKPLELLDAVHLRADPSDARLRLNRRVEAYLGHCAHVAEEVMNGHVRGHVGRRAAPRPGGSSRRANPRRRSAEEGGVDRADVRQLAALVTRADQFGG
jgi:hypothetical protein